jgi:CRISPR-associated endonuclease/helicase Cas3
MDETTFGAAFEILTGNPPFPWQWKLYAEWFSLESSRTPAGCPPAGRDIGRRYLASRASRPPRRAVPRRLVYVVNRRTVVDQTTNEAERLREKASAASVLTPAISTLRGQFADNREWSADPSRPAIIVGTVDMIGSRLLFSGYGVGFKGKPLHAGFLGQDALLVHDEAHLEPAFQELLLAIQKEQQRCKEFCTFRVMELSATPRGGGEVLTLSDDDRAEAEVKKRIDAKKTIHLHENKDEKKLAEEIADLALKHKESGRAVLVFVRSR